jgi:hypothetical protein
MSNSLAIGAVTATLRKLLDDGVKNELPGAAATAVPPDKASSTVNAVNLFLYQTSINAAFRNMDMPRQVKPNETGHPPLALNLHYLLTAYGQNDDATDPFSHRLLGRAMGVMHDHPILSSDDIKNALSLIEEPLHDLYDQLEHVRITNLPLTVDEMSKIWSSVQAKYRISTAYLVSVVLIESRRASRTPLPVLRRGPQDQGVDAQSSLLSPFPTLTSIAFATTRQPSTRLGETITITGHHLDGDDVTVRFNHPRLGAPIEIGPLPAITTSAETSIDVTLPDDLAARAAWAAGTVTVSLVITRNADPVNKTRTTNELSFALAPKILSRSPTTQALGAGDFTLTVTCSPEVRPAQKTTLLFGGVELAANAHPAQTGTLTFEVAPVASLGRGEHFIRLRVDGVDSLLIDYAATPIAFDGNQKVTIT